MKDRDIPAGERFITPEKAAGLFAMQVHIFPELATELTRVSSGSIGLVKAIAEAMAESISIDPMAEVNPARIREVTGAPGPEANENMVSEWGRSYWDAYKARKFREAQQGEQNPFSR